MLPSIHSTAYAGNVNVTDWAEGLAHKHADRLTSAQVGDFRALVDDGDGWVAAHDLVRDGMDDGWLDSQDVREAVDLARRGGFSNLGAGLVRDLQSYVPPVAV